MSAAQPLIDRTEALAQAVELTHGRFDDDVVSAAEALVTKARGRLRHGSHHTVIALAGPTGSGKSTLFNRLAGAEVSRTGVLRPTTSQSHAVVFGDDASALLDWLDIKHRHLAPSDAGFDGLVVIDLPDFDSTAVENRVEVDRLIQLVDLMIWVVEPQKYADQSLHQGYIQPLAAHADVMRFVLSKVDVLSADQRGAAIDDFAAVLRTDGITDPVVVATSATTNEGIDQVRSLLADAAATRQAMVQRLSVDLRGAAASLGFAGEPVAAAAGLSKRERVNLVDELSSAAGVDEAAAVVARQYRRDAALVTGWPPVRWTQRLRRSPVRDLPTPGKSPVARARVGVALRTAGDQAADGLDKPWDTTVRRVVLDRIDPVVEALARVNTRTMNAQRQAPRWWSAGRWVQRTFGGFAAVGGLWLLALALVSGLLRLDVDAFAPDAWDGMPIPTLLLLVGVVGGLLGALISRWLAVIGSKRRGRRASAAWREQAAKVAETEVLDPIDAALADRTTLHDLLATVAG